MMLLARVEDVPRARLDDDGEVEPVEQRARRAQLGVRGVIGGKVVRVRGERDGAIAELRDDVQRVLEPMMGEAVGVVAEPDARRHQRAGAAAAHASSASYCLYRFISLEPSGVLKKSASAPIGPDSPRCRARSRSRAMSSTSGAASTESVPSH